MLSWEVLVFGQNAISLRGMARQIAFIVIYVAVMAVVWKYSHEFAQLIPEWALRPALLVFLGLCAGFLFGRWHGQKYPSVRDE